MKIPSSKYQIPIWKLDFGNWKLFNYGFLSEKFNNLVRVTTLYYKYVGFIATNRPGLLQIHEFPRISHKPNSFIKIQSFFTVPSFYFPFRGT
jgi:hypothetical protein